MINNEFITKKQINIKVVLNCKSDINFFKKIFEYISTYLKMNVSYINNFNIKNISELKIENDEKIDFYFVDFIKQYEYIFAWNFYSKLHSLNNDFKLVLVKDKIENEDIKYFKNGADDIVYYNLGYHQNKDDQEKYLKWKFFSILRRQWDSSHNELILIRNGVIIDLIKRKVIVNTKEIKITTKEFEVLNILISELNQKNNFISKQKLFKKIYGIENDKNSRNIDQLIFRLKNKFNPGFFEINKNKGIRIA